LLIFQSLFMRKMMGGTYLQNVRRSFLPELISMNYMMAGIAPVLVALMMGRDMRAMWPGEPLFWMVMSLGISVGFAIAYPVNVWMVSRGMKHGLMTERESSDVSMGAGRKSTYGKQAKKTAGKPSAQASAGHAMPKASGMEGMDHSGGMKMAASSPAKQSGAGDKGAGQKNGAAGAKAMKANVTRPQLVAVTVFTGLMLLPGMTFPTAFYNLRLSAEEVRGAIMPPGMISDNDTLAAAMRHMAAVDPRGVTRTCGLGSRGARDLIPRIENGVKVFDLETSVIRWQILPKIWVDAYAFNGQVPGPTLRFKQGDRVRIDVTNHLPEITTVHWHGLILPNVMDGPAPVTQAPIKNGDVYQYAFTAV
jgi:hypothetical protein